MVSNMNKGNTIFEFDGSVSKTFNLYHMQLFVNLFNELFVLCNFVCFYPIAD